MPRETVLVAVVDDSDDARMLAERLSAYLADGAVRAMTGFYAGVAGIEHGDAVVVVDVSGGGPRQDWRLAELRAHATTATVVVVADETRVESLAGALRADLAVTSIERLPPLRELVVGGEPAPQTAVPDDPTAHDGPFRDGQTSWRRSSR